MNGSGHSFRIPGGAPSKIFLVILCAFALLAGAVRLHQERALRQAGDSARRGFPRMIVLRHLARCISLNIPTGGGAAETCLNRAESLVSQLAGEGDIDRLRTARSMIYGAVEASWWRSSSMKRIHRIFRPAAAPPGSHPRAREDILPGEPAAYAGSLAGTALVLMAGYLVGLEPLLGKKGERKRSRRQWTALAAAWAALFVVFVVCMLLA